MSRLFLYDAAHVSGVKRDLMVADHLNPFRRQKCSKILVQFRMAHFISGIFSCWGKKLLELTFSRIFHTINSQKQEILIPRKVD